MRAVTLLNPGKEPSIDRSVGLCPVLPKEVSGAAKALGTGCGSQREKCLKLMVYRIPAISKCKHMGNDHWYNGSIRMKDRITGRKFKGQKGQCVSKYVRTNDRYTVGKG